VSLTPGSRIGPYEIGAQIGVGGMGEVYRATDTNLSRHVAIKVLPASMATDADRLARFDREAKTLAALSHPNIAAIYGLERFDGQTALVMELVPGPTLAERIAEGPIPVDEALAIAKQVAEALEAAHEQGIIHRDLKPANVKLRSDGRVKVLDFGLAKVLEPSRASSPGASMSPTITTPAMTEAGMILGTAAYMSPEQARGKVVDARADVWAFGCVLYEMLTGQRAFVGEDVNDMLAAVLRSEPDWELLPTSVPLRIKDLLRCCLEKDVKNRRRDVRDLRIEIEQVLKGTQERPPVPAHQPLRIGRLAWIVLAVALAAAAGTLALAWAFRPTSEAPEMRVQINTPGTALPMHFALSPNGRYLVFVAGEDRPERLWLRPLDVVEAQPMPQTEGAQFPFWSADSRSIGFFASGKLYRIDIKGGPPQALADAPNPRGGTWNADGVIVFAPLPGGPLMRTAASGADPEAVTMLVPGQVGHRFPQFLPDGRRFLFNALGDAEREGIYLGALDGGDPKRLTTSDTVGRYLEPSRMAYERAGTLVARRLDLDREELTGDPETLATPIGVDPSSTPGFSVSSQGHVAYRASAADRRQLAWYDRSGKVLAMISEPDANDLRDPELAPEGRRVAVDRTVQGNRDIWLMDVERSGLMRFTFDGAVDAGPVWSPDGTKIAFLSARKGKSDLYVRPSNGATTEELLLETPNDKWTQDWSRDGRYLLYREQDPETGFDLKALTMTGGERTSIAVANTRFEERYGQFSPDGRWVAYATDESGRFEIVVQPFPEATGKWQVSTGGGSQPRWRADGKELYFIASDGTLMATSIIASGSRLEVGAPAVLFQARFQGGSTANPAKHQYAVSRDGRFLINRPTEDATLSPITLILNWRAKP